MRMLGTKYVDHEKKKKQTKPTIKTGLSEKK